MLARDLLAVQERRGPSRFGHPSGFAEPARIHRV